MILEKISRREVLEVYSTNSFNLLEDYDGNFPEISPRKNIKSIDAEINQSLLKRKFTKIVKSREIPEVRSLRFKNVQPITVVPEKASYLYSKYEKVSEF